MPRLFNLNIYYTQPDSYLTAVFSSSTYIILLVCFYAQQNRIHPFRDDRRSKSIEEREEEYQRVRERIFAQDVSSCFNCLFRDISLLVVSRYPTPLTL